jgi:hypothetical protein
MTKVFHHRRELKLALVALVVLILYSLFYVALRYKGEIIAVVEDSSRGSFVQVMPTDSDVIRGQLFNASLTEQEVSKLVESEGSRVRFLQISFGPAMYIETIIYRVTHFK